MTTVTKEQYLDCIENALVVIIHTIENEIRETIEGYTSTRALRYGGLITHLVELTELFVLPRQYKDFVDNSTVFAKLRKEVQDYETLDPLTCPGGDKTIRLFMLGSLVASWREQILEHKFEEE